MKKIFVSIIAAISTAATSIKASAVAVIPMDLKSAAQKVAEETTSQFEGVAKIAFPVAAGILGVAFVVLLIRTLVKSSQPGGHASWWPVIATFVGVVICGAGWAISSAI